MKKTKNIPIVVDNNRYRGGKFLIKHFDTKLIILDDGFQHRSLSRNLDIVLINGSTHPSDYSILTIKLLRETWSGLQRADAIIFTKDKPKPLLLKKIKKEKLICINSTLNSFISYPKGLNKQSKAVLLSGIGDPKTFETIKTIEVCTDKGFVEQLNELEYINGEIYANIYTSNLIAIINPNTGGVRAIINANNLEALGKGEEGDYFNGIAYNKNLFVTGKFWNKLFEIKIE